MKPMTVDSIFQATHHVRMHLISKGVVLSSATTFVYEWHECDFLITNWHTRTTSGVTATDAQHWQGCGALSEGAMREWFVVEQ